MTSKVFSVRPILLALTTSCFSTMRTLRGLIHCLARDSHIPPYVVSYALGSEVLITPPLSAKEALGGTASFTCTVTAMQDSLPVDWYIQLANGNAYYWSLHFPVLQAMGFALDGTAGPATSTLHVLANTETNGTWVQCIATRSQGDVATSNSSSLFVFGEDLTSFRFVRIVHLSIRLYTCRMSITAYKPIAVGGGGTNLALRLDPYVCACRGHDVVQSHCEGRRDT